MIDGKRGSLQAESGLPWNYLLPVFDRYHLTHSKRLFYEKEFQTR